MVKSLKVTNLQIKKWKERVGQAKYQAYDDLYSNELVNYERKTRDLNYKNVLRVKTTGFWNKWENQRKIKTLLWRVTKWKSHRELDIEEYRHQ